MVHGVTKQQEAVTSSSETSEIFYLNAEKLILCIKKPSAPVLPLLVSFTC